VALRDDIITEELTQRVMSPLDGIPIDDEEPEDPPEPPYDYAEDFWLRSPYFSDRYARQVVDRFSRRVEFWENSALGRVASQAYRAYHNLSGIDGDPITQLQSTGEVGELLAMAIPHYRTLVRHQIALFTSERPAWDPQARTSDAASARQVPMAANLLDFVASSGSLDPRLAEQAEIMMTAGAAYFLTGWDDAAGLEGRGWFTQRVYAPWEMAHEQVRTYDDTSWWIFRSLESRWDWVAKYAVDDPEKAERIAKLDSTLGELGASESHQQSLSTTLADDGDRIPVLITIARPTLACPEGRYSIVAGDDLVLFDAPYPFGEDVTISRMCASEFLGTSLPYSDSWGVLAAAEASNAILSMIMTRVDTCGVPNFCVPEGSDIEFSDIAGANAVWKLPPGSEKPSVVDLLQLPDALPAIMGLLGTHMEETVGINSVTKGQPKDNVSSGSMAALLQSMAIQFNNNLERAWILNLERIGTHHIRVFQRMATSEHAISVVGSDNKWTVQEFSGESLKGILRVAVKTASALSKTTGGRAEIADKLLERSAITPQEYLKVIQTGQLQPTFHGPVGELNSIKARSEKLLRGEKAPALIWDNHQLCIRELKSVLNTEAREDPQVSGLVNQTIQEHFDLWGKLSREAPDMLVAIGCPPLPQALQTGQQAQAMEAQSMQEGAPPGAPPDMGPPPQQQKQPETDAPRGRPGPAPAPRGSEPSATNPKQPTLPKPAKDPMTGESVV
jgi:hypothetical protein